jgi:hypothetical protein
MSGSTAQHNHPPAVGFDPVYKTPGRLWVVVALFILGSVLAGVGVVARSYPLDAVGGVLILISVVLGWAFGIMKNVH